MRTNPRSRVFREAVLLGDYPLEFVHPEDARRFVAQVLVPLARSPGRPKSVLECGCGTGGWLALLCEALTGSQEARLYGFDITPEMVRKARERLSSRVPPDRIRLGDVLDERAYDFDVRGQTFDLVYAYDLVQQLPRGLQIDACEAMARRVARGGSLVVFDHERLSPHGVKMGFKKIVTRFLGIPLVPRYYCAARYPSLRALARRLAAGGRATEIRRDASVLKRALVVHS